LKEADLVVERLRTTFEGRAWHGPPFTVQLEGVDAGQAKAHPIEGRHCIWEIVNHAAFWMEKTRGALEGEVMPEIKGTEDWPHADETEEEWTEAKEELRRTYEDLIESVTNFDGTRQSDTVPGRKYNFFMMLHGIVDHNVYHMGQVAILRAKK
jgi:uncharacterized damage-inducible protein DinB